MNREQKFSEFGENIWQDCQGCTWRVHKRFVRELPVFEKVLQFQFYRTPRNRKTTFAEIIRQVCTKLHFTCPEEVFLRKYFLWKRFLISIIFLDYGEQYCRFMWKRSRPSFQNIKMTFIVSRGTVWGRTSFSETIFLYRFLCRIFSESFLVSRQKIAAVPSILHSKCPDSNVANYFPAKNVF